MSFSSKVGEVWNKCPWATRHINAAAIALFVVAQVDLSTAVLGWRLPNAPFWHLWRYFTAPLSTRSNLLTGIMLLASFCSMMQSIELNLYPRRSAIAYYLLWLSAGFDLIGPLLGSYNYLDGLTSAFTYTLARWNPGAPTTYLIFKIQMKYVPFANLLAVFLSAKGSLQALVNPALGIALAHSFLYLTEQLPRSGGPRWFASPPRPLEYFDQMELNEQKVRQYGPGRKLGKDK